MERIGDIMLIQISNYLSATGFGGLLLKMIEEIVWLLKEAILCLNQSTEAEQEYSLGKKYID